FVFKSTAPTQIYTLSLHDALPISAMKADGSGTIVWERKTQVYVPSMLVHDKHLYAVTDGGNATCWKCGTGDEMWKERLNGAFTRSEEHTSELQSLRHLVCRLLLEK